MLHGPGFQGNQDGNEKVIWPEKHQMVQYTIAVIVSVILVSFLIVAVDFVFSGLSKLLVHAVG